MAFSATGGTKTTDGPFTVHTFTSSGTLECSGVINAEVLVIAGGGGGGQSELNGNGDAGGGGGGGGFLCGKQNLTGNMGVTVGGGGAGSSSGASKGTNGENSIFGTFTAIGGGGGGSDNDAPTGANLGADGGSGGGAASSFNQNVAASNGTSGQGNAGAGCDSTTSTRGGAGGGGASSAGSTGVSTAGGVGGAGRTNLLQDSTVRTYSVGGSGGACQAASANGADASANTGNGGGGGASGTGTLGHGGNGGSGIVIIRYLTEDPDPTGSFSATGGTKTIDGDYTVHKFTSSGTLECTGILGATVLIVGGGGGGGSHAGGGGGAGGVVISAETLTGTITVTVADGASGGAKYDAGLSAGNSSFGSTTAIGGDGGSSQNGVYDGVAGGSGGGGGGGTNGPTQLVAGAGTSGQGNNGGAGYQNNRGGGGGGKAAVGQAGNAGGAGGAGVNLDIVQAGTFVGYGGGGGGGTMAAIAAGSASHGGGAGSQQYAVATAGTANTGGGGGGSGGSGPSAWNAYVGANGGSGIVVVRYLTPTAWLEGWSCRKSITLSRASGAVTNYQMKLLLGESAGATGEDVDCGGLCLSTFNDIRFTTADGTTLLDYWIESLSGTTPNQLATIWIEFDSISTSATTFYMYYGKADAPAVSNGVNTFQFFDDFERGSNGDVIGGSWTVISGAVTISTLSYYSSNRCGRAIQDGTVGSSASFPLTPSSTISIRGRFLITPTNGTQYYLFNHGNGTKRICVGIDGDGGNDGTICYYTSSWQTSGVNITADGAWQLFEINNFNWTAYTCDIWLNGVKIVTDAGMQTTAVQNGVVAIQNGAPAGTGTELHFDDVIVRQFLATEPAWGTWGSEEEAEAAAGWTHKILGILPGKVMDILVANISKILNT